jgi:putative Mn2+ efflux pump MntP
MLAVLFMAGPGAILTAFFFDGSMKERMLAALFAGLIATVIVVLAAGIGTKALGFFNLNVLKISGGIAILLIGLLIMGLKINDKLPMAIILLGLIVGAIWRN